MKKYSWILVVAAVAPLFPLACGGGTTSSTSTGAGGGTGGSATTGTTAAGTTTGSNTTSTTTTGAGGGNPDTLAACDAPASAPSQGKCFMPAGGTTSSSASSSSSSSSGTGGAGGGPDCSMLFQMPTECGKCAIASCCVELTDCKGDATCFDCLTNPNADPAACGMAAPKALLDAISACQDAQCAGPCAPPPPCNPVSNEPCDTAAGEACDLGQNGFTCFGPPNDAVLCEACDQMAGPFCEAGHTCLADGACAAYCCDDADCGTGKCDKTIINDPDVGVCVKK